MLRDDLETGRTGLRWSLPDAFDIQTNTQRQLVAHDPERQVLWFVQVLPWPFDLRRAFHDVLRADLEMDARHLFEEAHTPAEWPPNSGRMHKPRTSDPTWSPIVEVEHVRIGAAPALRAVRRVTYQPGNEVLSATLVVPLAEGYAEIVALSRAARTGFRESVLMVQREKASPETKGTFLSQAEYDDPARDEGFPSHPLCRVRAAQRWLLGDAGLSVTQPAIEEPEGERVLEEAGCAVIVPPRYLFMPRERMPMAPTLASFVRVGLLDAAVRVLDVGRIEGTLAGGDPVRALKRFAQAHVDGWAGEGVTDLAQQSELVASDGPHVHLRTVVRFNVGEKRKRSVMRWRADRDGNVFRVAIGTSPHVPKEEVSDQVDAVMASLRQLDEDAHPPKKPWWKIW
ncbi:hypothetical protein A7982_13419 [Minicystis rosea]|nr:hypothetical protein A7982_13419 [Minicystis rosea]